MLKKQDVIRIELICSLKGSAKTWQYMRLKTNFGR